MHTYANLSNVVCDEWAQQCASRTPLLHVVRHGSRALPEILKGGALSPDPLSKAEATRCAEEKLEEPPAIYFYAGRAFPNSAGEATFLLSLSDDAVSEGRATPFDSGGVIYGRSKLPWANIGAASPAEYVQGHSVELSLFHDYFGHHLAAFFDSAPQYWDAPSRPIDGISFSPDSDFRDWTFEVRLHESVSIVNARLYLTNNLGAFLAEEELLGKENNLPLVQYDDSPATLAENDARRDATGGGP